MCAALVRHGVDHTVVRWIRSTLEGRLAAATLSGFSVRIAIFRGCPQVGVLSQLLWCLVVDILIALLSGGEIYMQDFVDGICLIAVGKFPNMVSGLMHWALHTVESCCYEVRVVG